jgi:hypothetical protein
MLQNSSRWLLFSDIQLEQYLERMLPGLASLHTCVPDRRVRIAPLSNLLYDVRHLNGGYGCVPSFVATFFAPDRLLDGWGQRRR